MLHTSKTIKQQIGYISMFCYSSCTKWVLDKKNLLFVPKAFWKLYMVQSRLGDRFENEISNEDH